jgi:dihydroflavonol-4-reductase
MPESVLVTGAYGFIASHCILQLLAQGHQVRGTLRSLEAHEAAVRHIIAQTGLPNERLSLVAGQLARTAAAPHGRIDHRNG